MHTSDKPRTAPPATAPTGVCCTNPECESGLRNNYYEGKRLTADTFRVEQRFLAERRHLLNRAIHGWGVVHGYPVELAQKNGGISKAPSRFLKVRAGFALDECGRELLHPDTTEVTLGAAIIVGDSGRRITLEEALKESQDDEGKEGREACWLLSVNYAEQSVDYVGLTDPCRCERHEWDHICETVRFTLRRVPCDRCCAGCECDLHCDCGGPGCCARHLNREPHLAHPDPSYPLDRERRRRLPFQRGGGRCLCDHPGPSDDCGGRLCEIQEPCGRVRVDLKHGVALACIEIVSDDCGGWTVGPVVDVCGPRRLVKRNDLLFDLVRGCDLTRIVQIGWRNWHRRQDAIAFDDFSDAFGPEGHDQPEYVTTLFWIEFSRPVRKDTVLPDCFAMTVMAVEREGNWRASQRVPIVRVDTAVIPDHKGDPTGYVRGARLVVDGGWVEDALRGRGSLFYGDTWLEIEVRGDFIIDCNGQPVDANAVGLLPDPTGNGTPGGTFLSTFQVAPREPYGRPGTRDIDRLKGA